MGVTREQLEKLKESMDYKFRVQSTKFGKATILSYVDSRGVQDRLDEALGAENWQDKYQIIDGNLFCGISVKVSDGEGRSEWVTKWDVGTESNVDKEKGNSSDAFKRAAVKWSIGRFLYSLGTITLKAVTHTNNKDYPAKSDGTILWSTEELNEYCKDLAAKGITDDTKFQKSAPKQPVKPTPPPVKKVEQPKGESAKTTSGAMTPNKAMDVTDEESRKAKAKKAFEGLDKATVLGYIIKDLKLKYVSINDFIEKESIDLVLSTYEAVKALPKKEEDGTTK